MVELSIRVLTDIDNLCLYSEIRWYFVPWIANVYNCLCEKIPQFSPNIYMYIITLLYKIHYLDLSDLNLQVYR